MTAMQATNSPAGDRASGAVQARAYRGPALLSYGFRPFFLAGALWAAVAVALWLPMLAGTIALPTTLSPLEWHIHELLYGYVPAVIAGFLLTAVPNWTGRLPVVGGRLILLFLLWVAGRATMLTSAWIGAIPAALVDMSFLAALGAVVAREILGAGNTRNFKVLVIILLLLAGNGLFHLEAVARVGDGLGMRLGIAATVLLIMLIGGRIIPSFTRNWLARRGPGRLPAPEDWLDVLAMTAGGSALAVWVILPRSGMTALLAGVAALLNAARLTRWAGERTLAEPLVLILHVAYAFVPLGFALAALSITQPGLVAPSGALHCWTAGAIGVMTLAVMTRASLGHTGQPLTATRPIQLIYLAAIVAATTRIAAALRLDPGPMLKLSATAWVVAFAAFVTIYWPLLARARASSR